ncbi:MAG: hypothetical protein ACR650_09750 [Methylocystis sp.]
MTRRTLGENAGLGEKDREPWPFKTGSGLARTFDIGNYKPPGPVAAAFIASNKAAPFLMGPEGGGKTTATIFKCLLYTASMPPCKDGVIRAKGAVVRADYRTLYKTTLSSWHKWFPRDFPGSKFIGGADRPATHEIFFVTPRGRKIHLTVEFQALGDNRIEDVMKGWEGSWAWLNEADLLDESALDHVFLRTTRWPSKHELENDADLTPHVFGDLNPPGDPDHWIVKRFIDNPTPDVQLFQQPSGLSPQAENIENLAKNYYQIKAANNDPWHVHRFVHGKIGYDRSGMPVYPEFDPAFNVAPCEVDPSREIHLGCDISGLHPAVAIVQRGANLQFRVLEEIYGGRMGVTRFSEMVAAVIAERYSNCRLGISFYDPANDYGADKEGGELSAIDIFRKAVFPFGDGPLVAAPSNEIALRVEAVRNLIVMPVQTKTGMARGLVVDGRRCPMLVKGFMSHYRYLLNPNGTVQNAANPKPEKGKGYDNPHDALQYVCLGLQGVAGAVRKAAQGFRPGSVAPNNRATVLAGDFTV